MGRRRKVHDSQGLRAMKINVAFTEMTTTRLLLARARLRYDREIATSHRSI